MLDVIFALKAFGVVMTGMVVITLFLYVLRVVAHASEAKASGTSETSSNKVNPDEDTELIAVLAAAAHAALGVPVRIHHVKLLRPSVETWARAGRMDIMFSHRVDPKR